MQWEDILCRGKHIYRGRKAETRGYVLPCEARESEGLGISLDVWGRAEGGLRGDLQVSAYMVTFTEGMNIGKGMNLREGD